MIVATVGIARHAVPAAVVVSVAADPADRASVVVRVPALVRQVRVVDPSAAVDPADPVLLAVLAAMAAGRSAATEVRDVALKACARHRPRRCPTCSSRLRRKN